MKYLKKSIRFHKVILSLLFSQSFFVITFVGNIIILVFSLIFFSLESKLNTNVTNILDAIWWGFSTATTVGYGDIIPVTIAGKILGIALMLVGTALFATYTALFAQTILEDEFFRSEFRNKSKISSKKGLEQLLLDVKYLEGEIKVLEQENQK